MVFQVSGLTQVSLGKDHGVGRAVFLLEALENNAFPCLVQLLEVTYIPWLMDPTSHLSKLCFHCRIPYPTLMLLALSDKDPCGYIKPIQILLRTISPLQAFFSLTICTKSLLPCNVITGSGD